MWHVTYVSDEASETRSGARPQMPAGLTEGRRRSEGGSQRSFDLGNGMILGTAGHVDHGKTTLVRALTGVDCDRLQEEQRRGITIELGFAPWALPNGEAVSIVDVPGHEQLVRTMLVGAGGIQVVLLTVSAVSGVMPQTREHISACEVLGVERGVVAMTFADRVDDPAGAASQIREELRQTRLFGAIDDGAVVPVCAPSGHGLPALTDAVVRQIDAARAGSDRSSRPAWLPVDRVFSVSGFGTVVTGALISGRLGVGDRVAVVGDRSPEGQIARVRGLQIHGQAVEQAVAGQRVAINLAGVPRESLSRGATLCVPGCVTPGRVFDAELRWLGHAPRALGRRRGLTLHLAGERAQVDVQADQTIPPGGRGTGRVRLSRGLPLPPGAHFVLRGEAIPGFGAVIGGGRILDAHPPRRRKVEQRVELAAASIEAASAVDRIEPAELIEPAEPIEAIAPIDTASPVDLTDPVDLSEPVDLANATEPFNPIKNPINNPINSPIDLIVAEAGRYGLDPDEIVRRLPVWLPPTGPRRFSASAIDDGVVRLARQVAEWHEQHPMEPGMPRARLLRAPIDERACEDAVGTQALIAEADWLRLPTHRPELSAPDRVLARRIVRAVARAGMHAVSAPDLRRRFGIRSERLRLILLHLERETRIAQSDELCFPGREAHAFLIQAADALVAGTPLTVTWVKQAADVSRKQAIPLLRWLDRLGVTRRDRSVRVVGSRASHYASRSPSS